MPIQIRILAPEDARQFVALRRLALQTDPSAFSWNVDDDPNAKFEVVQERLSTATPDDRLNT